MDGAGVITFNIFTFQTPAIFQDYEKWGIAAYSPMLNSTGARIGSESGFPVEDSSKYRQAHINYFQDFENYYTFTNTPEFDAYWKDIFTTWKGKFEISWQAVYFVIKRFKSPRTEPVDKGRIIDKTTYVKEFAGDDAPVILVRGLELSPDTWEKYEAWVKEWGNDVYIPLLLKIPGVTEICRCWLSNLRRENAVLKPGAVTNPDYPSDLSLIYFASLKAYQGFLRSKELAAYDKTLAAAFPEGLKYKWNTAFRLANRTSK